MDREALELKEVAKDSKMLSSNLEDVRTDAARWQYVRDRAIAIQSNGTRGFWLAINEKDWPLDLTAYVDQDRGGRPWNRPFPLVGTHAVDSPPALQSGGSNGK